MWVHLSLGRELFGLRRRGAVRTHVPPKPMWVRDDRARALRICLEPSSCYSVSSVHIWAKDCLMHLCGQYSGDHSNQAERGEDGH